MPTLDFDGTPLEVNDDGFLLRPAEWNEDVARFLGRVHEGQEVLTKQHWAVLNVMRQFWEEHDRAPLIRILCRKSRVKLKAMYDLFPSGPAQGACKVAGLPNADGCV
jgi:dissimilatory sulfite reductase related protein